MVAAPSIELRADSLFPPRTRPRRFCSRHTRTRVKSVSALYELIELGTLGHGIYHTIRAPTRVMHIDLNLERKKQTGIVSNVVPSERRLPPRIRIRFANTRKRKRNDAIPLSYSNRAWGLESQGQPDSRFAPPGHCMASTYCTLLPHDHPHTSITN